MYRYVIKRILDILLSIFILPLFFILFIVVGIAIKIEDGGSIFYLDKRYGKNMKVYTMYKFRSMKENAPDIRNSDGTTFNSSTDSRVTKVGKFIRKTSIDEIPQILNVFLGQMSFVGPRPSPLGDKKQYGEEFFRKFEVLPGITGYNQAYARNQATMVERIKNDTYYVENLSFILDLKVIIRTFTSVLASKNIYRN